MLVYLGNNFMSQIKYRRLFDFLLIAIGCAMLPLWSLGFYHSFKEDPTEVQGLVMSFASITVSVFWIATAFFAVNLLLAQSFLAAYL